MTLITYFHFATALLSRQFLDVDSLKAQGFASSDITQDNVNMRVPLYTIVEFFVFCGWLKVASDICFPLYGQADDFELNEILDLQVWCPTPLPLSFSLSATADEGWECSGQPHWVRSSPSRSQHGYLH